MTPRSLLPIPGARRYRVDPSDDPPTIYTDAGFPRRPNHKKAIAIWCDDGIRRCRTASRWAALATLGAQIDRHLKILDPDRRSQMVDRLALDQF